MLEKLETVQIDTASEDILVDILKNAQYMSLATCVDNTPLSTTAFFAFGGRGVGQHALYWLSSPKSKHSQQIEKNPNVSATIYDQNMPQGTGFGFRFNGAAKKLTEFDFDSHKAYELLKDKADNFPECLGDLIKEGSLRNIYMMSITDASANGAIEYQGKPGWVDFSSALSSGDILRKACMH